MKTWVCICGFKTGSARGWKSHIEKCDDRRYYLQKKMNDLNNSLVGRSFNLVTGIPASSIIDNKNNK